ncbi:heparin lyase I family protein [Pendulispora albinea]|uniref:Polysaccharide lyase n=1 Tax=Pendulispora albinea TaxID=2741071 RepID=A0ABZ2M3D2_9BACT
MPHFLGNRRFALTLAALVTSSLGIMCAPAESEPANGRPNDSEASTLAPDASWQLKWSPEANRDGLLKSFEGVEDDRANSHTEGQPHIFVQDNNFRFNMHTVDRDASTDRQRQEVKGMRASNGANLEIRAGETWRLSWSLFIPSSLKATTSFTHIMQLKQPGDGSSPILVMSLRRRKTNTRIEVKVFESDTMVGEIDLAPLQDKWISTDVEFKAANGPDGWVRWVVRDGEATVLDKKVTGVDTFLADRVRPKWGIYRSLADTSGSLQDCYMLTTNMRAYQLL